MWCLNELAEVFVPALACAEVELNCRCGTQCPVARWRPACHGGIEGKSHRWLERPDILQADVDIDCGSAGTDMYRMQGLARDTL
jgi:hypothetical protein